MPNNPPILSTSLGSVESRRSSRLSPLSPGPGVFSLRRRSHSPGPQRHDDLGNGNRKRVSSDSDWESERSDQELEEVEFDQEKQDKPVSWASLPRKDQLFVVAMARLSEPLTSNSLNAYMYYQLRSFDPSLPDATISYQAGIISAAFPAAQCLTAMLWGRFADSDHGGRKKAICIGLLGTMLSMIGFGFSQSFPMAVAFRFCGGVLNGNIGVLRTMISEIIKEKKYQSRAFLILPMTFNIGVLIGPIIGGILADPVDSYPAVFGPGSRLGGKEGVQWMIRWPYALPNLMSAIFLFFSACSALLFLEETSESVKYKLDRFLQLGHMIRRYIFRQRTPSGYRAISTVGSVYLELQNSPAVSTSHAPLDKLRPWGKLPWKRLWTRNLIMTLISHSLLALHVGTFNSLWYIYLSAPLYDPKHPYPPGFYSHGLFWTGGLGLPPARIGVAGGILGAIGITLQLFLYPKLSHHLGSVLSLQIFTAAFPIAYTLAPCLSFISSLLPSSTLPTDGVSGPLIWICICIILLFQVVGRTFALPATTILVNNASPHPSVLGTVHGLAQSFSSFSRTVGPILFSWVFGKSLNFGLVGLSWWILAAVALAGMVSAEFLFEGDGHEVLLDDEVRDEDGVVRKV